MKGLITFPILLWKLVQWQCSCLPLLFALCLQWPDFTYLEKWINKLLNDEEYLACVITSPTAHSGAEILLLKYPK